MKIKINIHNVIFLIFLIIPITTLLQGFTIFSNINRIMMAIMLILLSIEVLMKNKSIKDWILLILFVINIITAVIVTGESAKYINDIFYFPSWFLILIYAKENFEKIETIIENKQKIIKCFIWIWNIMVIISLFFSSSYTNHWGDGRYFKSFSNGEHRFANTAIYMLVLTFIIYLKSKKKLYIMLTLVPIITIYMSGARTYLGILVILLFCVLYLKCNNKFILYSMTVVMGILLYALIAITPMGEKFTNLNDNVEYLGTMGALTSGRSIFWEQQLSAFSEIGIFYKIFGAGYNFVYDVSNLWAHNDFINILLNYGFLGELIYLYVYFDFIKVLNARKEVPRMLKFCNSFIWFFNAMFNMVYTYLCVTILIPFLAYLIILGGKTYENKKENKSIDNSN